MNAHQIPSQALPPPPPPPPPPLPPFQPQMQAQQQGFSQQKQGMQPQQSTQVPAQQKSAQGTQGARNPYATYDPQMALWILEKPKNAESWEDVEPLPQQVAIRDLQNDLKKFRRNGSSVGKALNEISSANARRIISELVIEQNRLLWQYNSMIQWTIASVEVEWKSIDRRHRKLRRIQIILETESSGFRDSTPLKSTNNNMAGNSFGIQNTNAGGKGTSMHSDQVNRQNPGNQGQGMGPLPKNNQPQGHPVTQNHNFEQQQVRVPPPPGQGVMHGAVNLPPPPPPQMSGGQGGLPPPPPPPGPMPNPNGHPKQGPHQQPQIKHQQQQARPMPGAFPEPAPHPVIMGNPTRATPVEVLNPHILQGQKARKPKSRHGEPLSDSESETEWDTESSSASDPIRIRTVENGEYGLLGKPQRGRSRTSQHSRKRHDSLVRDRSRSRGSIRVSNTHHRAMNRRRDSDLIEPYSTGKHSPQSSKPNSPRTSAGQLPTQVHIHMNTTSSDDRTERRASHTSSHNDFRKSDKILASHIMSRGSSRDRGSDTASIDDGTSSVLTADDSVFSSRPSPPRSRIQSRTHSEVGVGAPVALRSRAFPRTNEEFNYPHPSHIHDPDRQPKFRYLPADDYPHQDLRSRHAPSYFDESQWPRRPGMSARRNSMQLHSNNPFDSPRYPQRSLSYTADMGEPPFPMAQSQRYITDRSQSDTGVYDWQQVADIVEAMEHINQTRRQPPLQRRSAKNSYAAHSSAYKGYRY